MENELNNLQITVDSFARLIQLGAVYVDKTGLILELLKSDGPYFLARPRRFGKSLLVDTIRQIFEGRRELFTGLEIDNKTPNLDWKPFPVIRINMNTVDADPDQFQDGLISKLMPIANSYNVTISQSSIANAISDLIMNISIRCATPKINEHDSRRVEIGEKNVVLLIDEYDFPLLKHLRDPLKIEKIRSMLYDFYSSVKGCSDFLRFTFITGITKFKQLSLFSALNNIEDISFDDRFSLICGFSKDEITTYYSKYLDRALSKEIDSGALPQGSSVDDIMRKISFWYDGYSWDGTKRVYNPFSIKNYLQKYSFKYYWYKSGVSLFTGVLNSFDENRFSIFGKNISIESPLEIQDTSNINDETFLLQAGYLTVDTVENIAGIETFRLKIPNNEIRFAINQELSNKFRQFVKRLQFLQTSADPLTDFISMKDTLLSTLWSRNENESEKLLSSIFSGNPKEWYRNGGEGSYKLILLTIMRFGGAVFTGNMLEAIGEMYSDSGRADLLFDVSGKGFIVIELKFASDDDKRKRRPEYRGIRTGQATMSGQDPSQGGVPTADMGGYSYHLELGLVSDKIKRILEGKITEAFNQILKNNYVKPYLVSGKPVLAAAIAIFDTSDVMVRFAEVGWHDSGKVRVDLKEINDSPSKNPAPDPVA
jgi:hypothetical protein